MSRRLTGAAAVGALMLMAPGAAQAAWFPGPEIVSVDNARQEQADSATSFAAISGDGRYVVLQTKATNFFADGDNDPTGVLRQGGIFRYDRQTGATELVADGDQVGSEDQKLKVRGGANPSVSADGSVVAFSTAQRLVPGDTNDNVDVYVRNMHVPVGADRAGTGAYTLASARSGENAPPTYEPRDPPLPGATPGSDLWPGHALSADGRYVAFRTVEQRSNLAATAAPGAPPEQGTPAGTVFVRDLVTGTTTLVSSGRTDRTPIGGAEPALVLSADGSTVAWVGRQALDQTRFLRGEVGDDQTPFYLWRRWNDPGPRTRRPTGAVDLDDPGCSPDANVTSSGTQTGPCYGPLNDVDQGLSDITRRAPALSADGRRVALLSGAGSRGSGDNFGNLDLFVTDMSPGVSRKAGTRQLTTDTVSGLATANPEIESVAMNAAGTRLAFTSARSTFLLTRPAFVGAARSDLTPNELFTVDLAADTLERVPFAPGAVEANGSVLPNPTLSGDGLRIAYVSRATNLLLGDANDVPDAFVSSFRFPTANAGPPPGFNRPPSLLAPAATDDGPQIDFRARRRKDGAVTLLVRSPVAGRLVADALTKRRPKPPKGKAKKSTRKERRVARTTRTFTSAGQLSIVLKLKGSDGRLIRRGYSLPVDLALRLSPAGGGKAIEVFGETTFRGTPDKRNRARPKAKKKASKKRAGQAKK